MFKKHNPKNEDINFWQSSSDLMTALMLILILVILLLALCLIHNPDEDYDDYHPYSESSVAEVESEEEEEEEHEKDHDMDHENSSNGGGGGGDGGGGDGDGNDDGEGPEDEPGEYPMGDEGTKSAVYVMLVDGETRRTIEEAGVEFDLRSQRGILQILNTYYPEKITYREYQTTDKGVFFLPEKIPHGQYYLRNLSQASGYDLAEDTAFEVDRLYDWPEPLVVTVPVYPSRNVIRVRMTDEGKSIEGGSFDIIAKEDVTTLDGTTRYRKGEIVGSINCGEDGTGESDELYLGTYTLKQKDIPEYYAGLLETIDAEVGNKDEDNDTLEIENEKTRVIVELQDELTGAALDGVEFNVSDGNTEETYKTDNRGKFELTDIPKDTTYTIKQVDGKENYIVPEKPETVKISTSGRIGREAEKTVTLTNRILRVNIGAEDAILGGRIADISLSLYDGNDGYIRSWTTSGTPVSFTDLKEGSYYLTANGNEKKHYPITIANTKEEQNINISIWTWKSYAALAAGALIGFAILFVLYKLIKHLITRKKNKNNSNNGGA